MSEYLKSLSDEQVAAMREHFYKLGWGQNETMWKCWNQALDYLAPQLSASQAREAELREKLEATELELMAEQTVTEAMTKRAEAAEARIKASQEQEPVAWLSEDKFRGDFFSRTRPVILSLSVAVIPLYSQPVIPPELAELQRELTKSVRDACDLAIENAELRKLLEESKVPEGWQLVPKEPTKAMCLASLDMAGMTTPTPAGKREFISIAYHAMLAAAPQPPKELKQ